jgi:hypothetical protein
MGPSAADGSRCGGSPAAIPGAAAATIRCLESIGIVARDSGRTVDAPLEAAAPAEPVATCTSPPMRFCSTR